MPEDDENDFDLDLDLDLGLTPEAPAAPAAPAPAAPVAPTPAAAPPAPAQPVQAKRPAAPAAPEQPVPAAFRKREPLPEAPQPTQPVPAQQTPPTPAPEPAQFPPPAPKPAPVQTPAPAQQQAPVQTPQPQPAAPEQPQQPARPAPTPAPAPAPTPAPAPQPTPAPVPAQVKEPLPALEEAREPVRNKVPEKRSTPPAKPEEPADPFATSNKEKSIGEEVVRKEAQAKTKREPRKRRTEQAEPKPPAKQKRKPHPSEESTGSLLRRKLMIGIPVLALLAFVAFKFVLPKRPKHPKLDIDKIQFGKGADTNKSPNEASQPPTPRGEPSLPPVDRSKETPDERDERAQNTLANFFGANKKESMLEYVRQPLRVSSLMRDYYSRKPFPPSDEREFLGLKSDLQQADAIGANFYSAEADLGGPRSHTMILEDTAKGFRVDWEYYVQYNPMEWSTFIKEAPTPPSVKPMDFRVYARIVPDYRTPFTDEQRYLGIELMTLNDTSAVIGYVQRSSALGKRMQEFLAGKAEELCILRLEFPGGSKPGDSAVHIRELVNPHWIITDETSGY